MLKEEQVIYQQSLEKIVFWLDKHYGHFPQKAQLVKQIVELQTQSIVSVLPDISASLLRINDYLQYQKSLGQTPSNGQTVENAPAVPEAPQETAL